MATAVVWSASHTNTRSLLAHWLFLFSSSVRRRAISYVSSSFKITSNVVIFEIVQDWEPQDFTVNAAEHWPIETIYEKESWFPHFWMDIFPWFFPDFPVFSFSFQYFISVLFDELNKYKNLFNKYTSIKKSEKKTKIKMD